MLTRVRAGFALLAVVLLIPLGVLIARSFDTLERDRELQHAAVANRVFDEAERELAAFVRQEQARPADQYRGGAEPLRPSQPFVLGYFQVDRGGRLETPYAEPGTLDDLRAAVLQAAAAAAPAPKLERIEKKADLQAESDAFADASQVPGTARNVQSVDLLTGREMAPEEPAKPGRANVERSKLSSSSEALERLGEIAKQKERSDAVAEAEPAPEARAALARDERAARSGGAPAARSAPAAPIPPAGGGAPPAAEPALAKRAGIAPSRLAGERVSATRMLLFRTALLDDGAPCQQGLWIDVAALGRWLRARVLGGSELRDSLDLELLSAAPGGTAALPEARFVYDYRFAEPFDALQARLAIAPLGDGGAARYIAWMAVLMVAASTLGLYALYRTAAVAIHFGERRSNFAAAVSHELKTPLTAIRMYAEMLRDGMAGDEAKRQEYYATITSESERLTRLINNVLEWSRLESQQRERAPLVGPIGGALREVVRVLEPHARALGFELALELPADLPAVRHDPDALQQILFNLIDNALKYARGAELRRIEIQCARADGGACVRVRDHGPGVPPRALPLIFDAFYRAGDELTRQTKGTGIGLALVRGLAEAMGGSAQARNAPGGGLEVELRLRA